MSEIIGIKQITTKTGKTGTEYSIAEEFSDYDKEHSVCQGRKVITEYSSASFPVNVGDEVTLIYGKGFQGRAQLVNIIAKTTDRPKLNPTK